MAASRHRGLGSVGRLGSVGIELSIATVGGLLGGGWLDGQLGTAPWLALLGLVAGAGAGFRLLWRTLKLEEAEAARRDRGC